MRWVARIWPRSLAARTATILVAVLVAVQRLFLPIELDPPTGALRLPVGGF